MFRCDRILAVAPSDAKPLDLRHLHLENRAASSKPEQEQVPVYAELTKAGVQACEAEPWPEPKLHIRPDGTGWLAGSIRKSDIPFFATFFIGLGNDATVSDSPELLAQMKTQLSALIAKYGG